MASEFRRHYEAWKDCRACPLWRTRARIVVARGTVPCDVLFVGEAPGESENVLGRPFVGPAGRLLDAIVYQALGASGLSTAFTNLVCCIPRDPDEGGKAAEPPDESIEACRPRLEEFVRLCRPRLLVAVGRLATDWLTQGMKYSVKVDPSIRQTSITHPAAILRANVAQRGLAVQRCVVTLRNAAEELADADRQKMVSE